MPEQITAPRIIGILGTSRSDGNTGALASAVFGQLDHAHLIDLNDRTVAPYDYDNNFDADDFLALARLMVEAETVVFASPVYWYPMSAQLKVFFDRLSGLTDVHKPLGKQLAGKTVFTISTGSSPVAPPSFVQPFIDTAGYFDMHWGGSLHASLADNRKLSSETLHQAKKFSAKISASLSQTNMQIIP